MAASISGALPLQSSTTSFGVASSKRWRRQIATHCLLHTPDSLCLPNSRFPVEKSLKFYRREDELERREFLILSAGLLAGAFWNAASIGGGVASATAAEFTDMPALRGKDYGKTKMRYPDYIETESGLQYKDLRVGDGPTPKIGQTVVVDWDGYTIGYYGRIFEARNKTKGGSFVGDDKDFFKFKLGSRERCRIIVPPELGYPDNDFNKSGPRPTTFSGQRALDFVLRNQGLIDKTLLFDIELLKIMPS